MPTKVNDLSDAATAMLADLQKVNALMGGTKVMRAAKEAYLPKWPMEDQESYDFRVKTSTLYNAYARTVNNMTGKPFSEPLTWADIDPEIEAWFDNIDLAGRNLQIFARDVFRQALNDGLTHVWIDHPPTKQPDGTPLLKTIAEEKAAGVRPYAIHVKQEQILGWKSESVNGMERLTQLRFMERVSAPDGDFGDKKVDQVRVLEPGKWQTYRKNEKQEYVLYEGGVTTLDFIPVKTFYTNRTGFMTGTPPLNDLADLNIKHWQSTSDQDSILHTARVPILAISGVDDEARGKLVIGSKSALFLPQGGEAAYVEHTGAAIEAGSKSLKDLEAQMESMGAELLIARPGDKTATEAALDTSQEQCQLAAMAQGMEDFLDELIDVMAAWVGKTDQGDITVFKDFATISINAASVGPFVTALVLLVNAGLMSKESAFNEMRRYGIIDPDLVWEVEQERINSGMPTLLGIDAVPVPA